MFILNPTEEQLNSWYKTDKIIGEYLIDKLACPVICIKGDDYYFVSTLNLIDSIYKIPFFIKFKSFINGMKKL